MARATLSLVVPVYNEEARLPGLLDGVEDAARQCSEAGLRLVELVVVDDGSTDRTAELLSTHAEREPLVTAAFMLENRGKGAVVAEGVRRARGELVLITDVDMSTPLSELGKLHRPLTEGFDLAIGSRSLERALVERSRYRDVMSRAYNALVRMLTGLPHRDTQCGFKLVPTELARALLSEQLIERYAFDVETLLKARAAGLSVAEVPVRWVQDEDSRVTPLPTAVRMALDTVWIVYQLRWRRAPEVRSRPPIWARSRS